MRKELIAVFVTALACPTLAVAQEGYGQMVAMPASAGQSGGRGAAVVGAVETRITPGRPYAAEAVTETTQALADGNRINRTSMTKIFRDGEGRTRREMYAADGTLRSIAINDPVAHVNYTLDPEKKIAFKSATLMVRPSVAGGASAGGFGSATAAPGARGGGGGRGGATGAPDWTAAAPQPTPSTAGGGGTLMRTPAPDDPYVKKEDLGSRNIEGVMAAGTRTTTTIPAGQIGNAQDIRIVSEQWFSDDLQVLVMTKHTDPRSGETTYRLRNILRAEPDPSLFAPPPDYTVEQRGVRRPE